VTSVWGIHAGGPRSPFLQSGVVVPDRAGIRDLRLVGEDREATKRELTASYPDAKPGTVAAWAGVLLRFAFEPEVGDLLAHPERATQTISIGRIESDYFREAPDRHCRRVPWVARRIPRRGLSDGAHKELSARVAFFAVRNHADELAERAGGGRPEAGPRS
jgi:predicted Mrr-cat superfamily restriction endonuclease